MAPEADVEGEMVAGARNHPNYLVLPFRFELIRKGRTGICAPTWGAPNSTTLDSCNS